MYSEMFRTRKVLEALRDANETTFANNTFLHGLFQDTWKAREIFCKADQVNTPVPQG